MVFDQNNFAELKSLEGWKNREVASKQMKAYEPLLKQMHEGKPREDFITAARALELTGCLDGSVLEVGCGNGYYSEVLKFLTKGGFSYHGVDFSDAMLESARNKYPDRHFSHADACNLGFADNSFNVVWSGTVLMHVPDFESAVKETVRVSNRWCVFHSTPLVSSGKTVLMQKKAYGSVVPEVLINKDIFEGLLRSSNLRIRYILNSLQYEIPVSIEGSLQTLTYVCEKHSDNE
jgi:ubiquinone/menaquinone biosynthesis C-methylase UbiE